MKSAGIADTKENCWKYMIDKVRRQLKIVLCFSPVGSVLRVRARKFPAIVNCTAIDWFHEWPHDALVSVSQRFLKEIPSLPVCIFFFSSVNVRPHYVDAKPCGLADRQGRAAFPAVFEISP